MNPYQTAYEILRVKALIFISKILIFVHVHSFCIEFCFSTEIDRLPESREKD